MHRRLLYIYKARAVFTKYPPFYSIVGGIPAKKTKSRFDEGTVNRLLEIKWWDWPDEKVRQNIELIKSGDISGLLTRM